MASYLDKLYPGKKGTFTHALTHTVADAAIIGGASFGFGYVQSRYREKAAVMGVPADLAAGIGMSALAFLGEWYGVGGVVGALRHTTKLIGLAGIGSYCHTLGSGHGAQASGVKRIAVHAKDVGKVKSALPNSTVLGQIPRAPHGDFLSPSQLEALARA
jgi:hypothetical protein